MHSFNLGPYTYTNTYRMGHNTHPLTNLQMSPGCSRSPISSHSDMLIEPDLSATLIDLTSCPSFVRVGFPAIFDKKMGMVLLHASQELVGLHHVKLAFCNSLINLQFLLN